MLSKRSVDMCSGPIFKGIVTYTVPIIFTGILQLFFNAADLMVVGNFCGSNSVGAVGATTSLINLMVNFFIGLSVGVTVCVANAIGAKNFHILHRVIHTAIPLAFISGAILTVIGILFSSTFLSLMDTPTDLIDLSSLYLRIYFCGAISNLVYNFGAAILRASGDTKSPLKYLTVSGILNVALNVVFVTVFNMNVAGVALATVISQTLSAVLVLRALTLKNDSCRFSFSDMKIHAAEFKKILTIGSGAGIQSSLFSISNVLIQSSINSFGAVSVAGNSAAANIENFVYVSMNSISQTAVNFVGQNKGACNFARIKKILTCCLLCVSVLGIALTFTAFIFGRLLLSIYITDNPAAIEIGLVRITIFLCYFICGIMDVITGAIRGLGNTLVPMLISVIGVCGFRVLWIFTVFKIPQFHSLESLYISYPISWILCIIAQVIAFNIIFKRIKELVGNEK